MLAAIIVALITAFAAIIAPVISSLISQSGSYKLAASEWFFRERVAAYKALLSASSLCLKERTAESIVELQKASDEAFLFSSLDVQASISLFGRSVLSIDLKTASDEEMRNLGSARLQMISSMQRELNVNYSSKHHRNPHSHSSKLRLH